MKIKGKFVKLIVVLLILGVISAPLSPWWSIGEVRAASEPWLTTTELGTETPPFPDDDNVDPDDWDDDKIEAKGTPDRKRKKGHDGRKRPRPRTIPHRGHTWGG